MIYPYEPTVLKENIFNQEQLSHLIGFVYKNKDKWINPFVRVIPKLSMFNCFHVFGIPPSYYELNQNNINKHQTESVKLLLRQNCFFDLVKTIIGEKFNRLVMEAKNFNVPGFHVLVNLTDAEIVYDYVHKHTDFIRGLKEYPTYPIIIPIKLPAEPCGLDWWDDHNNKHTTFYNVNTLYTLNGGKVNHAISKVKLKPGEARITFQAFCVMIDDKMLFTGL